MDKALVITGGSRGIGAATARLAALRGYSVCVNYRCNREAADGVVKAIEANGGRAIAVAADVSVEADVTRLFEASDKTLGSLAGLVNNAGVLETQMRVEAMDASRLHRVFATNVIGVRGVNYFCRLATTISAGARSARSVAHHLAPLGYCRWPVGGRRERQRRSADRRGGAHRHSWNVSARGTRSVP